MRVVPAFDPLEHGKLRFGLVLEPAAIQQLSRLRVANKLSAIAFSKASPTEPSDGTTS